MAYMALIIKIIITKMTISMCISVFCLKTRTMYKKQFILKHGCHGILRFDSRYHNSDVHTKKSGFRVEIVEKKFGHNFSNKTYHLKYRKIEYSTSCKLITLSAFVLRKFCIHFKIKNKYREVVYIKALYYKLWRVFLRFQRNHLCLLNI